MPCDQIIIQNSKHDGYRRAGIALSKGTNRIPATEITKTQLSALEADPHINVSQVAESQTDSGNQSQGSLASQPHFESLTDAILSLEPDNEDSFTTGGKPKTEVLSALMDRPVSAKERDEALAQLESNHEMMNVPADDSDDKAEAEDK